MSINPEDYIEHVAHRLLGEPNKALTTNSQLRFGTYPGRIADILLESSSHRTPVSSRQKNCKISYHSGSKS